MGELPVTLVVARYRHHSAGAVFHQHEVGCPHRHIFASQRVDGEQTGGDAFFLHGRHVGFRHFSVATFGDKVLQRRIIFRRFLRQRVTGRHGDVGHAHEGVRRVV